MLSQPTDESATGAGTTAKATHKIPAPDISADFLFESKHVQVLGSRMCYVEAGKGEPVALIHGNPTSSYLWRNVIPYVEPRGRAIALDLIGMGRSDKPDIAYSFEDHYRYFDAFIDAMKLENVTFVGHDWGATLAFEYARRRPDRVRAVAFMEGLLPPIFPQPSYEAMGQEMGSMFKAFRDPQAGVQLIVEQHLFVEQILPGFVNRPLSGAEMEAYRFPYKDKAARKPLLAWPRQVPIAGEPPAVSQTLNKIGEFMAHTELPVLLLYASPGTLVTPDAVSWYTQRIKNLETVYVGPGLHFIQEDQPEAIGRALADWLRRLGGRRHGGDQLR
jgi:haloalkane dehalogenase